MSTLLTESQLVTAMTESTVHISLLGMAALQSRRDTSEGGPSSRPGKPRPLDVISPARSWAVYGLLQPPRSAQLTPCRVGILRANRIRNITSRHGMVEGKWRSSGGFLQRIAIRGEELLALEAGRANAGALGAIAVLPGRLRPRGRVLVGQRQRRGPQAMESAQFLEIITSAAGEAITSSGGYATPLKGRPDRLARQLPPQFGRFRVPLRNRRWRVVVYLQVLYSQGFTV